MDYVIVKDEALSHYGIKGMHWGVRRYQNYDGTRIGSETNSKVNKVSKKISGYNDKQQKLKGKQYNLNKKANSSYKKATSTMAYRWGDDNISQFKARRAISKASSNQLKIDKLEKKKNNLILNTTSNLVKKFKNADSSDRQTYINALTDFLNEANVNISDVKNISKQQNVLSNILKTVSNIKLDTDTLDEMVKKKK